MPDEEQHLPVIELAAVEDRIAASAEAIWHVLTDFGHPQTLAPTIIAASVIGDGVGAIRIVTSSRGLEIHEKLILCDRADYLFRYAILDSGDMPFAHVTSYICTVQLTPLTDTITDIRWRSEGTVDGPLSPIREFLTTLYRNANRRIADQISKDLSRPQHL